MKYLHPIGDHPACARIERGHRGPLTAADPKLYLGADGGEFLGCVGLHRPHTRFPELGIWLKKSAQGMGYGSEAIRALKDWADRNLDYVYLVYPVDRNNSASRRIPESLGGKPVASYEKMSMGGNRLDIIVYRIDAESVDRKEGH